ncbi:MAG: hypothetical protein K0Q43_5803 [Ramlibacter sp.]|jgi:hypothetical protein|nr:hypothetical protein [Ramlibacter sp.]MCE3270407.1 hypothetical protein [Ramlibacter sp.]MDF2467568.1 hypothetical protein [Ramlibacter sp.]
MDKNNRYPPQWAFRGVLVLSWCWVFLIAQFAVLAHGVVHADKGDRHCAVSRAHANESVRAPAHDATKGLNADSSCELFEAAGQSFVSSGAYGMPRFVAPSGPLLAALSGEALARWAGLLNARGPPASA